MTNLEPVAPAEVLAAIRAPFLGMGAAPVDVPVMQPLTQLLDLAGEAVRARLFTVQADGVEAACLRPDFTIPVARAHIASGAASGRYLYEGKAFRVAPAGSARPEEFTQIGVEVYGRADSAPALDSQVAILAWRAAAAGGRKDLTVQLGDVSLFRAFIRSLALAPALEARLERAFLRPRLLEAELDRAQSPADVSGDGEHLPSLLAGLPEGEATAVLEELWSLAGIQPVGGRSAAEIVHRLALRAENGAGPRLTRPEADLLKRFLAVSDVPTKAWDAISKLAKEVGVSMDLDIADLVIRASDLTADIPVSSIRFSTAFGREFSYYDGFLFEVRSAALGEDRPIAAGGRYDSLLTQLGAAPGGAVGCMVRPWRAYAGGEQ